MGRARGWLGACLSAALFAPASAAPLDKLIEGPKRLCFSYSTFSLLPGERVADFSGTADRLSITVDGPRGRFEFSESRSLDLEDVRRRLVVSQDHGRVYRLGRKPQYAVFGRSVFSPDRDVPIVRLSGPALRGGSADATIYRRVQVRDPYGSGCEEMFAIPLG